MTAPLGVALIGAGSIGVLRAAAVRKSPHFRLAAISDVRGEAARVLANRHGCRSIDDSEEASSDPEVGMVIVATPPDQHGEAALAAIAAGKHVLCEKPLAHSVEAGREMCERAEERGVMLKTGFNHRYFPAMTFARGLIDGGRIGDVVEVRARAAHPGGAEFGHDWVHDARITGGGSLVDNGIHLLDLVRFFLGEVHRAQGYVANLIWPFDGAEDTALALFRASSGGVASVEAVWTDWRGYHFSVEALGTRGYVRVSYPPMFAEWGESRARGVRARRRFKIFPLIQFRERLHSWRWTIVRSFLDELAVFARAIREGSEAPATGRDGLRALEMAAAVYRSSSEGIEVHF